jgi:hypothetical protein
MGAANLAKERVGESGCGAGCSYGVVYGYIIYRPSSARSNFWKQSSMKFVLDGFQFLTRIKEKMK